MIAILLRDQPVLVGISEIPDRWSRHKRDQENSTLQCLLSGNANANASQVTGSASVTRFKRVTPVATSDSSSKAERPTRLSP